MNSNNVVIWFVAAAVVVLLGLFLSGDGCIQPDKTRQVLSANGYSEIVITGWRPLSAGENDFYATGFKAKAPNGTRVEGTVTSGIFKGNTIRLD